MKPVVYYIGPATPIWENRAELVPINHRNHVKGQMASNWKPVITSPIVSWNKETGLIETLNTFYKPADKPEDKESTENRKEIENV